MTRSWRGGLSPHEIFFFSFSRFLISGASGGRGEIHLIAGLELPSWVAPIVTPAAGLSSEWGSCLVLSLPGENTICNMQQGGPELVLTYGASINPLLLHTNKSR